MVFGDTDVATWTGDTKERRQDRKEMVFHTTRCSATHRQPARHHSPSLRHIDRPATQQYRVLEATQEELASFHINRGVELLHLTLYRRVVITSHFSPYSWSSFHHSPQTRGPAAHNSLRTVVTPMYPASIHNCMRTADHLQAISERGSARQPRAE